MLSIRAARRVCGAAALLAGLTAPAFAHVIARPGSAAAGSIFKIEFFVGHGCDGSPTVALHVKLPEGVTDVVPEAKQGWTLSRNGEEIDWRGGAIGGHDQGSFFVTVRLPDAAGTTLYFNALQECQQGSHRWNEIPAPGQDGKALKSPAPFIKLTPRTP